MIAGECAVFLSMLVGGMLAAAVATFFLTLGGASKAARAIFDFLAPIAVGAIFCVVLYDASGGVFRSYALIAFGLGGYLFRLGYRKSLPTIRRIIRRISVPIKSLESRINKRLEPYRKRREERIVVRRKKREEERMKRADDRRKREEEKARIRLEKRESRENPRRLKDRRKKLRSAVKKEGRAVPSLSSIRQSH